MTVSLPRSSLPPQTVAHTLLRALDSTDGGPAEKGVLDAALVRDFAHDLANQLAVIVAAAELAGRAGEQDERFREDVDQIKRAAERAIELTTDLHAAARRAASVAGDETGSEE